jgi:hypothetical protein
MPVRGLHGLTIDRSLTHHAIGLPGLMKLPQAVNVCTGSFPSIAGTNYVIPKQFLGVICARKAVRASVVGADVSRDACPCTLLRHPTRRPQIDINTAAVVLTLKDAIPDNDARGGLCSSSDPPNEFNVESNLAITNNSNGQQCDLPPPSSPISTRSIM